MRVVVCGSRPDGHARVVIEELLVPGDFEVMGLLDDLPDNAHRCIGMLSVIGTSADLVRLCDEGVEGMILGFGAAEGRSVVSGAADAAGLALPTLVHSSAHLASSASVCDGVQVLSNVVVGTGAWLGRGALLNSGAIVEHDAVISDFAVIGPGAVVAGRARIGEGAEVGAGAIVLPDVVVSGRAVVGAGAVVTHAVCSGETVVGVPARMLSKEG